MAHTSDCDCVSPSLRLSGSAIPLPTLNFATTPSSSDAQELDVPSVASVVATESDVMPTLGDIVSTYTISDTIPPPLTSLTTLTTSSTLDSVFNEPIMSVAVVDPVDGTPDILQS